MKKFFIMIVTLIALLLVGCLQTPEINIKGDKTVKEGESIVLDVEAINTREKVTCESENNEILTAVMQDNNKCLIAGIAAGVANVIFTVGDYSAKYSITVIEKEPDPDPDDDDDDDDDEDDEDDEAKALAFVNSVMESMTIEEKIGQMFVVGFVGPTIPNQTLNNISQYKFGNYIFMQYNTEQKEDLLALTTALQNNIIDISGVPAFITIDQEGGQVTKFISGANHFIGNMALAATGDANNAYLVGKAVGSELRNYGINVNFAPVLDVNNNPYNPIIGIRSYSDDPEVVSAFGGNMIRGLRESQVLATAKHFPGHGDTDIDTHYGLPRIPHNMERLYQVELYPYIKAIEAGIDAIMTTHIVFDAVDPDYPATLSYPVLTGLLRGELGFSGLIITDGMEMGAIKNNFGYEEAGVLAVLAGVDILTFTESTTNSVVTYNGVLKAVRSGRITEARIDESVRRILLKKYKYNLFTDYLPQPDALSIDLSLHQALNESLSEKSLTLAKGDFGGLDQSKSTLIISTGLSRYSLAPGLSGDNNSFAYLAKMRLSEKGYNIDYKVFKSNNSQEILEQAKEYDQVIIAFENAAGKQVDLVKEIYKVNQDIVVVALNKPYDINYFPEVKNYICVYEYTPLSVSTLIRYLNGEFTAEGTLPVALS
ncbi:MAG: glycoside hydrolase family 3 N-terminal domain-containing protein, partial [Bacilli bacterium]|nr:glycoside hydrolase family 3 N-terminal domain-containing protein [Bacilli bacterium]